jgi:hypothetical protein
MGLTERTADKTKVPQFRGTFFTGWPIPAQPMPAPTPLRCSAEAEESL